MADASSCLVYYDGNNSYRQLMAITQHPGSEQITRTALWRCTSCRVILHDTRNFPALRMLQTAGSRVHARVHSTWPTLQQAGKTDLQIWPDQLKLS